VGAVPQRFEGSPNLGKTPDGSEKPVGAAALGTTREPGDWPTARDHAAQSTGFRKVPGKLRDSLPRKPGGRSLPTPGGCRPVGIGNGLLRGRSDGPFQMAGSSLRGSKDRWADLDFAVLDSGLCFAPGAATYLDDVAKNSQSMWQGVLPGSVCVPRFGCL